MVSPFVSNHVPAVDTDFVTFINEFLFNAPLQDPSARSILRYQRTLPRRKRYRAMWRAAATSLTKKRKPLAHGSRELPSQVSPEKGHSSRTPLPSADNPLRKLPLEASLDEGHALKKTHSSTADQFVRNLPFQVFLDDEHKSKAVDLLPMDQPRRDLPSHCSLAHGGDLAIIDVLQHDHDKIDVDAIKGPASGCCSKTQPLEAMSTPAIPKHSSRKPPRPPRGSLPRSGSQWAIRLKNAARKATVNNARIRKQKLTKSTLNATTMWALIITLCSATIMLVQGLLGINYKSLDSRAEGQPVGEGNSSHFPYLQAAKNSPLGVPPSAAESSTQPYVAGHEFGTSLDKLQQQKRRELRFMNRFQRLGAT